MADVVVPVAAVEDKLRVPLVDSVVGEMHHYISAIALIWRLVFVSCKAGQSLFVYVHPKRVDAPQENIYPEIELQAVDQIWFLYVLLNN